MSWVLQQNTAYFFVIHGSRDPRPNQALQKLLQKLRDYFPGGHLIDGGALECAEVPLEQQIVDFGQRAFVLGITQLRLVPLFLLPGVHVKVDIPAAVDRAVPNLPQPLQLVITPHLGAHPDLATLITKGWASTGTRLLLAHGSRRPEGNQAIAALAEQLRAIPAYWATPPHLADVVENILTTDLPLPNRQISIFPYFLFPGTILDAMIQTLDQFRQRFSAVDFCLERPLEVTDALAGLVSDLAAREDAHDCRISVS